MLGEKLAGPAAFQGARSLGAVLMTWFFATIGAASGGGLGHLATCGAMIGFIGVMVLIHWSVMLAAARWLRLPAPEVLIGSNVNIGGPATAGGMAAACGWQHLVQPALMVACLGYAGGTACGLTVAHLVHC